ncbi:MAG: hypothetical protein JOZ19_15535 [Rubrobacter sp.]|nr:hypothetical protein [Rubrobacter sp.]
MMLGGLLDSVLPSTLSEVPSGAAGKTLPVVGPARVVSKDAKGTRAERRSCLSLEDVGRGVRGRRTGVRPIRWWAEEGSDWSWRW